LTEGEWERVPLAAVLDPRGSLVHFSVVEAGQTGITLIPRETGGVDRVSVELGADDMPVEVVVRDPQGAVNRLRFFDWRPSPEPPQGQWLPPAPEGVECVADPGALD
jgi:hypothetical protein